MRLPARILGLRAEPGGDAWLGALPALVGEVADRWGLALGEAFEGSNVSWVAPAGEAVLKLQFPHVEVRHEAEALRRWDGNGAVRLLRHDPDRHALLLERCRPGTPLSEAPDALDALIALLPRLWVPAGAPFATLADEAAGWAATLEARWEAAGRPCDRRRVDQALAAIRELSGSQPESVLLHQDLHGDNVLSSERGWLAIDPKPLVGERAFGVAPIVRSPELGHSRREVRWRLDRLTAELGLDRERARGWTLAQTLAWGFDTDTIGTHLEVVEWLT